MVEHVIIEPCCFITQLDKNLSVCDGEGTFLFITNGDVTLNMFLDYLVRRAPGGDVFVSLINVELDAIRAVGSLLREKQADGTPIVNHITILSQGKQRELIQSELGDYRKNGRLTVCEDRTGMRCLAVGNGENNYVLQGSINQLPNHSIQMMSLSVGSGVYADVMKVLNSKSRMKALKQ